MASDILYMPAPDCVEAFNNKGGDSPECLRFSQASIAVTGNSDDCGEQTIHLNAQNNDKREKPIEDSKYDILVAMLQYVVVINVQRRQSSQNMFEVCEQSLLGRLSCTVAIPVK